jgi:hypothetical protein
VNDAGWRIEPPVSEPSAPATIAAATATALPPDEPPGVRRVSQGFLLGKNALFSVDEPIANSSWLHLPTRIAPAARRRATTVASYGGQKPRSGSLSGSPLRAARVRILEPAVVGASRVQSASLIPIGTPASAPRRSPRARLPSIARASSSARSPCTVRNAP